MARSGGDDLEAPLISEERESGNGEGMQRPPSRLRHRPSQLRKSTTKSVGSGRWQFRPDKFLTALDEADAENSTHATSPGTKEYYRKQRETIAGYNEVDAILVNSQDENYKEEPGTNVAINLSNILNIILLIIKVFASWKSGSLAIVASTLDSLLDLLAGLVLFFANLYMKRRDHHKYPIGKLRIQPVGIVVFAAIMATLGLQVLIAGVEQLMAGDVVSMNNEQRIWLISIMLLATFVKLGLFLYCRSFHNEIVLVYAQDHFFDVVTNVVGLVAALLGDYFYWWIDPIGAIILAIYTIINWGKTVLETAGSLVGKAAPPALLQKLTYMAYNHHSKIDKIETVRAYTFGSLYFVEIDIVLPETMPLKEAHEIGEDLQNKVEAIPEVERAFVHLDYNCTHRPEHSASEFKY